MENTNDLCRWTLTDELAKFGVVRQSGCILTTDGFTYLMYAERNKQISHSLDFENTTGERLKAHWIGFIENQKKSGATLAN
jgi:hypothetical protein